MRTLISDSTADMLLDYLASDGNGDQWVDFAALREWEVLFNLGRERRFIYRLARNLARRGLAETRRVSWRMQLRLTPAGIDLARQREQRADAAAKEFGLDRWVLELPDPPTLLVQLAEE